MAQQSFPQGGVPAAYVKALVAELARLDLPSPRIQGLLDGTGDDETASLALSTYLMALDLFAEQVGAALGVSAEQAVTLAHERLLDDAQLGLFSRLLRRHDRVERLAPVFERLHEDELFGSAAFHVSEVTDATIRGTFSVRHDPRLEEEPLLVASRRTTLTLIARMYGYDRSACHYDAARGYTLRYTSRRRRWPLWGALAMLGVGCCCAWLWGWWPLLVAAVLAPLLWRLGAALELGARAEVHRDFRARAMERQLVLGELSESRQRGELYGQVVAGLYRVGARMGSGGSGVVFAAERITDAKPVALKLLRAATAHDVTASDRLRREAAALGLAWHPNVVEVLDHGSLPDGSAYMVMERLQGESLADRLRRERVLDEGTVQAVAHELLEALVAVHAAGVVHRDVTPENVFLLADADRLRIKLLDFGIARVEWEELRITGGGGPLGTPGYMAPEQAEGEVVDARADVYAVGALLHTCFFGAPPGAAAASSAARSGPPSGVRRTDWQLGGGWRELIARATATRPEHRYADARAVLAALRELEAAQSADASGRME